jgi:hypothetical protein
VVVTSGAAQMAKSSPASRAQPQGGGYGSSPRWVRIFSITGRWRMVAILGGTRRDWTSGRRHLPGLTWGKQPDRATALRWPISPAKCPDWVEAVWKRAGAGCEDRHQVAGGLACAMT